MSDALQETHTWPQLASSLYDKLTGRNAEITYDFDDFDIHVPSGTSDSEKHAHWKVNGVLKIRTRDVSTEKS